MLFMSGVQEGAGGGVSGASDDEKKFLVGMVMADHNTDADKAHFIPRQVNKPRTTVEDKLYIGRMIIEPKGTPANTSIPGHY
jgi:hypothetical protein